MPKAGGTTLRNILKREYSSRTLYEIGENINRDIVRFRSTPKDARKNIKILIGHMSHGLYKFFPGSTECLTMLRNPVDRVYSEYRFLSSNTYHPLYPIVSPLSYHQYLDVDPTRQASNGQTRLMSGSTYDDEIGVPGIEPIEDHHLELALEHLKRYYPLTGLLERFDETLLIWQATFNWQLPFYEKKNITRRKSRPLDDSEINHTIEKNQFDMVLYRQAVSNFNQIIKVQNHTFKKKLFLFKAVNRIFEKITKNGRSMIKKLIGNRNL